MISKVIQLIDRMRKKVGIIKGKIILLLIFLLSINSFAAIVSDNDGSAFITKAEFDALKSSFQSQIDSYNQSIDSKIDGAIASYLAGIKIAQEEDRNIYNRASSVYCFDYNNRLKYKLGVPYIYGETGYFSYYPYPQSYMGKVNRFQGRGFTVTGNPENAQPGSPYSFHKLLIDNIDYTNKTAAWVGYSENCQETFPLTPFFEKRDAQGYSAAANIGNYPIAGLSIKARTQTSAFPYVATGYKECNTSYSLGEITYVGASGGNNSTFTYNNPSVQYADLQFRNMVVPFSANQYEFNHATLYTQCAYCLYTSVIGNNQPLKVFQSYPTDLIDGYQANKQAWWEQVWGDGEAVTKWYEYSVPVTPSEAQPKDTRYFMILGGKDLMTYPAYGSRASGKFEAPPVQCFETAYITNFKQIYNSNFDDLVSYYTTTAPYNTKIYDSFILNNGTKHVALSAGYPLLEVKKNEKVKYELKFKDSGDYLVWMKLEPFDLMTQPQNEATSKPTEFLKIGGGTWDDTKKCVKVNQNSTISIDNIPNNGYIWIKWSKDANSFYGGGEILLSPTAQVTLPEN